MSPQAGSVPEVELLDPSNPFAAESALPHRLPPFDAIREEHHRPALLAGMAAQRAEVEAIATAPGEPTFEGVVVALERSGALLRRVEHVLDSATSSFSTPALRALEAEVAPLLAAHADAIHLDRALFARLDAVHAARERLGLDAEDRRLVERLHTDFVRAGAALAPEEQEQLRGLNAQLSELTTAFGTHLLEETNDLAVLVDDPAQLRGLTPAALAGAAQAARERGHAAGWLLPLVLPTAQPVLAALDDRGLRERVHRASISRGARGGEHDTRALVSRITALRARRAALLGFPHHAAHVVDDQTAGDVATVMATLTSLVPAAVANARAEAAALARVLQEAGESSPLQPWDWAWCAARLAAGDAALDPEELRAHFELDAVVTRGVFLAASRLYGVGFTERTDLPLPHPAVRAWEVTGEDGAPLGLFLLDPYARESKRGGAWMTEYAGQSRLPGESAHRPVVTNTLNLAEPAPGEPALLSLDEVTTVFHEFGHALHGLLSNVRYPRLAGTSVPRDFVEYPSQVNEVWAWEPEVLASYARHHATGEPLPAAVGERLRARADTAGPGSGQGFATMEILAAMLLDQAWHQLAPGEEVAPEEVEAFEAAALERYGIAATEDCPVPPRYRSTYFQHVFSGGYSAGYYSYLWSEVLDADTVAWFTERGGLRRENGRVFADALLSRGGAVDPMEAYVAFRGRAPEIGPLLRRRGLAPAEGVDAGSVGA